MFYKRDSSAAATLELVVIRTRDRGQQMYRGRERERDNQWISWQLINRRTGTLLLLLLVIRCPFGCICPAVDETERQRERGDKCVCWWRELKFVHRLKHLRGWLLFKYRGTFSSPLLLPSPPSNGPLTGNAIEWPSSDAEAGEGEKLQQVFELQSSGWWAREEEEEEEEWKYYNACSSSSSASCPPSFLPSLWLMIHNHAIANVRWDWRANEDKLQITSILSILRTLPF